MARKRASMREGPLAELFRATEAAQRAQREQPETPESEAPALSELDRAVDILVEMKDLSEATVGLAYSSILFNNRALAAEVRAEPPVDEAVALSEHLRRR